jgi:hypothetical protein
MLSHLSNSLCVDVDALPTHLGRLVSHCECGDMLAFPDPRTAFPDLPAGGTIRRWADDPARNYLLSVLTLQRQSPNTVFAQRS